MDSPLLKYSAKDYFFKAALCHFCIDMLNAKVSRCLSVLSLFRQQAKMFLSVRGQFIHLAPYPLVRMENSLDAFLISQLMAGLSPLWLPYILTVPFSCGAEAAEAQA